MIYVNTIALLLNFLLGNSPQDINTDSTNCDSIIVVDTMHSHVQTNCEHTMIQQKTINNEMNIEIEKLKEMLEQKRRSTYTPR